MFASTSRSTARFPSIITRSQTRRRVLTSAGGAGDSSSRRARRAPRRRAAASHQPPMSQRRWAPARWHRRPAGVAAPGSAGASADEGARCRRAGPAASRQPGVGVAAPAGAGDGVAGAAAGEKCASASTPATTRTAPPPIRTGSRLRVPRRRVRAPAWPVVERHGALRIRKKARRHVDGWWRAALRRPQSGPAAMAYAIEGKGVEAAVPRSAPAEKSARLCGPSAGLTTGGMDGAAGAPQPGPERIESRHLPAGRNPPTNSSNSPSARSRLRRYSWIDRCSRSSSSSAGRSSNGTLDCAQPWGVVELWSTSGVKLKRKRR